MLVSAWGQYYSTFGDGDAAGEHLSRACTAAGANVSGSPSSDRSMNCARFALAPALDGSPPDTPLSEPVAALLEALAGCIVRGTDGKNKAVMTPFWRSLLIELGFRYVEYAIPGDIVVYTLIPFTAAEQEAAEEVAAHFGIVRSLTDLHLSVESKSGFAFPTYLHPLNVIDPTYLLISHHIRVHFFRPGTQRPMVADLNRLAARYERRLKALREEACASGGGGVRA